MGRTTNQQNRKPEEENILLETEHFRVFGEEMQAETAQCFAELLEREYVKIHKDFHFPAQPEDGEGNGAESCPAGKIAADKLCCYLCSNVPQYLRLTGKRQEDYQPWMVGYSDSPIGKICLLLPGSGEEQELQELKKIAVHELVHIIFDRCCGVMEGEAWLCEGIAILYAGQTDLQYVSDTEYPKIRELGGCCTDGETPDEFADNGGYDYAGIYVWYFIEKYGFEKFLAAYKNELCLPEFIFEGFEQEAILAYRKGAEV
ncbi:MAG: hypothetical protein K2N94_01630 [Lachnospiraceae bacterium]|nr:hypothetical protein [Lachnospiraceae bacterium]